MASTPAPPAKVKRITRTEYAQRLAAPADGGIVVARGVSKIYESGGIQVPALRGVDLSVRKGEMLAIMGPSGCGKTTLLNVLSGIDEMTAGEVWIAGEPLSGMSDNQKTDFRAMKMGFIFQSYNLLPVLRAVENVELPLLVRGDDPKPARKKAVEALEAVGIGDKVAKKPAELSGGEQQRVSIARSLVNEPDIVFADEPTGNLDSETTADVIALMKRLHREKGLTFIIVTHDASVGNSTERVVLMRNGVITKSYRPTGAGGMSLDGGVLLALGGAGRKRFPLRIGVGNFFRRKTQVAIVVAGLLIGTAIISSSYVIQSTFDYTIRSAVFRALDHVDEPVSVIAPDGTRLPFNMTVFDDLVANRSAMPTVDALAPRIHLGGAAGDSTPPPFAPSTPPIGG